MHSYRTTAKADLDGTNYALSVLDRRNHVIRYLDWTENAPLVFNGIKPLPDGTGFYRFEWLNTKKEARIYFHSLP